jgi:paraquat-inducible protein B
MEILEKDFLDWIYQTVKATVRANKSLKVYAGPDVSQADFRRQCSEAAQEGREQEMKQVEATFDKKIDALADKLAREERELSADESDLSHRRMDEYATHAETIFGLFGRRRKSISKSVSKRRMAEQAEADVKESKEVIADLQAQIATLKKEKEAALQEVSDRWSRIVEEENEIPVSPAKKDILLDIFGVAWFPFYTVQTGDEMIELPGFGQ